MASACFCGAKARGMRSNLPGWTSTAFRRLLPHDQESFSFLRWSCRRWHSPGPIRSAENEATWQRDSTADRAGRLQTSERKSASAARECRFHPSVRRSIREAADRQEPAAPRPEEHGYIGEARGGFLPFRKRKLDQKESHSAGV